MINNATQRPRQHSRAPDPMASTEARIAIPGEISLVGAIRPDIGRAEVRIGDDVSQRSRSEDFSRCPCDGNSYGGVEIVCEKPRSDDGVFERVWGGDVYVASGERDQGPEG